jgi:hypothetical protein
MRYLHRSAAFPLTCLLGSVIKKASMGNVLEPTVKRSIYLWLHGMRQAAQRSST